MSSSFYYTSQQKHYVDQAAVAGVAHWVLSRCHAPKTIQLVKSTAPCGLVKENLVRNSYTFYLLIYYHIYIHILYNPIYKTIYLSTPRKIYRMSSPRYPEANGRLHAQLILERPQRRVGVVGPIAPGRARQTILEEHASKSRTSPKTHQETSKGTFQWKQASAA